MSLALHHMIQRAEPCSAGRHFMFLQYPSEYIHSLGGQRDGAVPAQAVQYFGRRQPFSLLVISGNAEIVVEQLLFGRYLFEIVVVFRHNPFVRLVEPIAFAVVQFVHGLGIKLVVVYRAVGVYCFRHFYADEPATAAGVGQQVLLVAGGVTGRGASPTPGRRARRTRRRSRPRTGRRSRWCTVCST